MKKLSGFSLMEMMIVLLIVSIIAGATAPMINKKLVTAASEKSPWVWIGEDKDIGYNLLGGNKTAAIGTTNTLSSNARLFIVSKDRLPHIELKDESSNNNNNPWRISTIGNSFSIIPVDSSSTNQGAGAVSNPPPVSAVMIGGNATDDATAVGVGAGANGQSSIALGSGFAEGIKSIAIGSFDDNNNVTEASADSSIAIGAGTKAKGQNSLAIGKEAQAASLTSLALGSKANASAERSIAIGCGVKDATNDWSTSAQGYASLAIGSGADAYTNNSIALGYNATAGNDGDTETTSAIAIGHNSEATGEYGIAIGGGNTSGPTKTRSWNSSSIAIGRGTDALAQNSIAIGYNAAAAAYDNDGNALSNTIAIGYGAQAKHDNSVAIGYEAKAEHDNSVAIGPGAVTTAANQIVLGDSETTVYIPGNLVVRGTTAIMVPLTNNSGQRKLRTIHASTQNYTYAMLSEDEYVYTSDRRLKNVGKAFKGGLEEIKKLEVFNYTFKKDKSKTPRVGVMAQDLEKIFPSAVTKGEDGFLRIRMEDIFYALVNAVKELDTKFDLLAQKQKKIDELEDKVSKLEKRLVELEKKIK